MEAIGNKIESSISGAFYRLGTEVAERPKTTLLLTMTLAAACGVGVRTLTTENRPEKLWVPQNTVAELETIQYNGYYPRSSRFNNVIVENAKSGENILTKETLVEMMKMHQIIQTKTSEHDNETATFTDLCTPSGGACSTYSAEPICNCLVFSILKQWNYDLETLENDEDFLTTLNGFGNTEEAYAGQLGNPTFDDNGNVVSADAISIAYFLKDRAVVENGRYEDPINEAWEEQVFLNTLQSDDYPSLKFSYLSSRSFSDEFGGAISGDLLYVQVSYALAFIFLGATLGHFRCGSGSRWAMAFSALFLIGLSTVAGFGISSGVFGLFFGPVHSLLPFILLGIGVDDVFVIVNAFNQERKVARKAEDDVALQTRSAKALSRAGASITVTSATDLVAFAISSSSALPALASFCAYASICIFFLWLYAATFFTATMVQDEKRQRDNRRDCLCCLTRKAELPATDEGAVEGKISLYFRKYHAPAIFSKVGKAVSLLIFSCLLGYGIYGAINLPVEDSERKFIPQDSYVNEFIDASDKYFSNGVSVSITFENGEDIYKYREQLANLKERLTGLSQAPPYIAEPNSDDNYQNTMAGFKLYLQSQSNNTGVTLGEDGWPTTYSNFVDSLMQYTSPTGPGGRYLQDMSFDTKTSTLESYRINLKYVKLLKKNRGKNIDDADKFIEAMDETRKMVAEWNASSELPKSFPYSDKYISIEGFKIIKTELFRNVGLAIACVSVIVLLTIGSVGTTILITLNVAFCIVEILGFMFASGIVIDSVSVINIVLAVGLSVDYSAHIGHCFMTKGGTSRDIRATEALADIGASVLNGATSTFLAVAVLLFSSSYVFQTLSVQFALTVVLGIAHGVILLPVMLSLVGPKPFASAEEVGEGSKTVPGA